MNQSEGGTGDVGWWGQEEEGGVRVGLNWIGKKGGVGGVRLNVSVYASPSTEFTKRLSVSLPESE